MMPDDSRLNRRDVLALAGAVSRGATSEGLQGWDIHFASLPS